MPRRLNENPTSDKRRRRSTSETKKKRRSSSKKGTDKLKKSAKKNKLTKTSKHEKKLVEDKKKTSVHTARHENKDILEKAKLSETEKAEKALFEKRLNDIKFDTEKRDAGHKKAHKKASHAKPHDKKTGNKDIKEAKKDEEDNELLALPEKIIFNKEAKEDTQLPAVVPDRKPVKVEVNNKVSAEIRNNFIKLGVMVVIGIAIIIGIYYGIHSIMRAQQGFTTVQKEESVDPVSTQTPRDRSEQEESSSTDEEETADTTVIRDISYGARDIEFEEKQINIPGIYDNEIVFSAGTGSIYIGSNVLSKLYLYNLDGGDETLIAESDMYAGEYYETLVNHNWIVWLETDHGTNNYVWVMNRSTGDIQKIQSFKEGQPILNLYGNYLVWMEQVSDTEDRLAMMQLDIQDFMYLHTFTDKATYGVSTPCIYEDTIVWADHDPTQTEEDLEENGEKSAIYYMVLETDDEGSFLDPEYYCPGTYVHEPLYNGDVFVWLDANKSPDSNLYIGRVDEEPQIIATNVTTYSIGDGIVVYGKDSAVWVYVIETGELCRLTSEDEMGMLPEVSGRTVVWYNLSSDSEKDVLRYKVLTDEDLYPGGLD